VSGKWVGTPVVAGGVGRQAENNAAHITRMNKDAIPCEVTRFTMVKIIPSINFQRGGRSTDMK